VIAHSLMLKLEQWMEKKRWHTSWKPANIITDISKKDIHNNQLASLHASYPLLKRRQEIRIPSSTVQTISQRISSTIPTENIEATTAKDICGYNEDLEAYMAYIKSGSKMYDGTENLQIGSVAAVAQARKNGIPWFGRILHVDIEKQSVSLCWLDRLENKTIYFYLLDSIESVHFDTIICSGVDFEPHVGSKLMWKLVTPLCFIQAMNKDEPPELIQQDVKLREAKKRTKYDLSQLVFANSDEFLNFVKVMQ
jgi:hypothetical protein